MAGNMEHRYRHAHDPAGPVVRRSIWWHLLAFGAAAAVMGVVVGRVWG